MAGLIVAATPALSQAQTFPVKPVRIITSGAGNCPYWLLDKFSIQLPEKSAAIMDIVITAIIASTRFMLAEYQPRPRITAG